MAWMMNADINANSIDSRIRIATTNAFMYLYLMDL